MTNAQVERIPFAAAREIGAHDDLRAFGGRDRRGIVRAIVRNYDQTVLDRQLRQDGPNRCSDYGRLIVRGHQHGNWSALALLRSGGAVPDDRGSYFHKQHDRTKQDPQGDRAQEGLHDNHEAMVVRKLSFVSAC